VLDEDHRNTALQAIAEYIGVAGVTHLVIDKSTGHPKSVAWWSPFTGSETEFLSHYGRIDPYGPVLQGLPFGTWVRAREIFSQNLLSHDEWYNDFILKGGVCDLLGAKLHESASLIVLIGFHRATGDGEVFPRNLGALGALVRPLCQAARLETAWRDVCQQSGLAFEALDRLAVGVIFVDGHGRVLWANREGETILSLGDGLTVSGGRLCARRNFESSKLSALIAAATGAPPSAECMSIGRNGGAPYVINVGPLGVRLGVVEHRVAMISISVPADRYVSEPHLIQAFGFSPAEARVAAALARGCAPAEIAEELGVRITTIRTHLSAILRKLDVERQADVVRLISRTPVLSSSP
jgi:DNA-binding CsgD family transcriptional regulator